MIPLRDDRPTRTFAFVTVALIALNTIVFLHELSLHSSDRVEAFFATFADTCAPHTSALTRFLSDGFHIHVSARRVDAHHRQHAVPLDFWEERRGLHRALQIYRLLFALWHGCGGSPSGNRTRFNRSDDWRQRRHFRSARRLSVALSAGAGARLVSDLDLLARVLRAGSSTSRDLVRDATTQRAGCSQYGYRWRGRLLGARRRICRGDVVDTDLQEAGRQAVSVTVSTDRA
jgi:hypothetical protein